MVGPTKISIYLNFRFEIILCNIYYHLMVHSSKERTYPFLHKGLSLYDKIIIYEKSLHGQFINSLHFPLSEWNKKKITDI